MSYPWIRREIREMIGERILKTRMARDIVRKGLNRPLALPGGAFGGTVASLWGIYNQVDVAEGGGYVPQGSVVRYDPVDQPEAFPIRTLADPEHVEFLFPDGAQRPSYFADIRDIESLRLLVTVTQAGVAGSEMFLEMWTDLDKEVTHTFTPGIIPFVDDIGPRAPLDEVGLYVSDWHALDFGEDDLWDNLTLPAQLFWWVSAPALSEDTVGIGLCQVQAKLALE